MPAVTSAATVPLTCTADADVVERECKLDAGAYATCASGWSGVSAAQTLAKFVIRTGRRPVVSYRCAKAGGKLAACS